MGATISEHHRGITPAVRQRFRHGPSGSKSLANAPVVSSRDEAIADKPPPNDSASEDASPHLTTAPFDGFQTDRVAIKSENALHQIKPTSVTVFQNMNHSTNSTDIPQAPPSHTTKMAWMNNTDDKAYAIGQPFVLPGSRDHKPLSNQTFQLSFPPSSTVTFIMPTRAPLSQQMNTVPVLSSSSSNTLHTRHAIEIVVAPFLFLSLVTTLL